MGAQTYIDKNPSFEDLGNGGTFVPTANGERVEKPHAQKNVTPHVCQRQKMPKTHPLHKPGVLSLFL
ncbi:MAG: hypothetical protein CM15mV148_210 [uncultured marine virus]|nr:MAG: hypothetical protein CM15mV148_210 [uncultured marine virus]